VTDCILEVEDGQIRLEPSDHERLVRATPGPFIFFVPYLFGSRQGLGNISSGVDA